MHIDVKRIGDWPTFARLAANLTRELNTARIISLRRWGLKAESIAKGHLSSQDLANGEWLPLSTRYLQWKKNQGFSDNTLIMTSTYFQNITTWVDRIQGEVYVGVKRGVVVKTGPSKGLVLSDIAMGNEYGVKRNGSDLPARPLWEPTLRETMQWYLAGPHRPGDIFLHIIRTKYP